MPVLDCHYILSHPEELVPEVVLERLEEAPLDLEVLLLAAGEAELPLPVIVEYVTIQRGRSSGLLHY
jgi:hypothetical protein